MVPLLLASSEAFGPGAALSSEIVLAVSANCAFLVASFKQWILVVFNLTCPKYYHFNMQLIRSFTFLFLYRIFKMWCVFCIYSMLQLCLATLSVSGVQHVIGGGPWMGQYSSEEYCLALLDISLYFSKENFTCVISAVPCLCKARFDLMSPWSTWCCLYWGFSLVHVHYRKRRKQNGGKMKSPHSLSFSQSIIVSLRDGFFYAIK